jgi:hypothetical protein
MYICVMEKRTRFIQLEFYTDPDSPSDYITIVEVVDDVPKASYTVKVPVPFTFFPRFPFIKN